MANPAPWVPCPRGRPPWPRVTAMSRTGDPLAQPVLLRLLPHGQLVPGHARGHAVWGYRLHRLLLGECRRGRPGGPARGRAARTPPVSRWRCPRRREVDSALEGGPHEGIWGKSGGVTSTCNSRFCTAVCLEVPGLHPNRSHGPGASAAPACLPGRTGISVQSAV